MFGVRSNLIRFQKTHTGETPVFVESVGEVSEVRCPDTTEYTQRARNAMFAGNVGEALVRCQFSETRGHAAESPVMGSVGEASV